MVNFWTLSFLMQIWFGSIVCETLISTSMEMKLETRPILKRACCYEHLLSHSHVKFRILEKSSSKFEA